MKLNKNYDNLAQSYLFSTIAKKVNDFIEKNPDKKIIRLGIGDVTKPLCESVINAMHKAVDEMSKQETFRGYGPEQGYDFLREAIKKYYLSHNVSSVITLLQNMHLGGRKNFIILFLSI